MTIILKSIIVVLTCTVLAACTTGTNTESIYKSLKDGQARVVIRIDGKPFYTDESVFTGSIDISSQSFKTNLFDQFDSNVVVGFSDQNWYVKHPIDRTVFANNQMHASVMMGKMVDKVNRYGTGYLMTEGTLSIRALSDEKVIIHFVGKVGKYSTMPDPLTWNTVEGDIIYKKPKITLTGVSKSDVYFE